MTNQLNSSGNRAIHPYFLPILPLGPEAAPELYDLWLDSVRATHDFLTTEDITHIGKEVQSAFSLVSLMGILAPEDDPAVTNGQETGHTDSIGISEGGLGTRRIAAFMCSGPDLI